MTCPKCGHQQSKAIECSACGIVIEKFIARQAMLAENPPEVVSAAATPYATPKAAVAEALPELGELKAFTPDGRIGDSRRSADGGRGYRSGGSRHHDRRTAPA